MHKGVSDPLEVVAGEISDESILLCLDEFMVCLCILNNNFLFTVLFYEYSLNMSLTGNWCGWCSDIESSFSAFIQWRHCVFSDPFRFTKSISWKCINPSPLLYTFCRSLSQLQIVLQISCMKVDCRGTYFYHLLRPWRQWNGYICSNFHLVCN